MKFINQNAELIPTPVDQTNEIEVLKFIERIGRVCYRSEDKITDDSAVKFVGMLKKLGHWAMLEHFWFHCICGEDTMKHVFMKKDPSVSMNYFHITNFDNLINRTNYDITELFPQLNDEDIMNTPMYASGRSKFLVSFNATGILNRINGIEREGFVPMAVKRFEYALKLLNPTLFGDFKCDEFNYMNKFIYFPKDRRLFDLACNSKIRFQPLHNHMTMLFTTDRGITHSLVRHRPCSFAMESTIYCNYSKDKFSNELTYIMTPNVQDDPDVYTDYYKALAVAETSYMDLLNKGIPPKIARCVLPHAIASNIVMTTNDTEWLHFFKTRCSDPKDTSQIRELANMAKDIFEKERNISVDDYQKMTDESPLYF